MKQQLRTWMLPLAMVIGGLGYSFFSRLNWLTPWLIAAMLFVTFCRVSLKEIHLTTLHIILIVFQIIAAIVGYLLLAPIDVFMAEALLICFLISTASSASAVTGMLGGNIAFTAIYTLLSSLVLALVAPLLFSFVGTNCDVSFFESFWHICKKVLPLLITPFVLSILIERFTPKTYQRIRSFHNLAYYLWVIGLTIVSGTTVSFIVQQGESHLGQELLLGGVALFATVFQFLIGRFFGRRYGDAVAGGQSLGQKNTILAIWMAQTYLQPLVSIAPAAYVLWQNSINSFQLWRSGKKHPK